MQLPGKTPAGQIDQQEADPMDKSRLRICNEDIAPKKRSDKTFMVSSTEGLKEALYIASPQLKIVYMNPAMASTIGWDKTGASCYRTIYKLSRPCPWCAFDKLVQGKQIRYRLQNPATGQCCSVLNYPLVHPDSPILKLSIFKETTRTETLPDEMCDPPKLDFRANLVHCLSSDIAHMTDALQKTSITSPEPLKEVQKGLTHIKQLAKNLKALLQDHGPADSVSFLQNIFHQPDNLLPGPSVKISCKIYRDIWPVAMEKTRLLQVLCNLILNAAEAMNHKGIIRIDCRNAGNTKAMNLPVKKGKYVAITITDSGCGISEQHLAKLFDIHFSTKQNIMGEPRGLGLTVARVLVENSGGMITVKSKPDTGTAFSLYLPAFNLLN